MEKIGCCPECGCEDEIYLFGETKLQLTMRSKFDQTAHFNLEDVYVTPLKLRDKNEKYGKFKCENCAHVFDEPKWD